MKRIFKSTLLVVAVAAIAGYATYSYFSDTEMSTGNNFTAGAIDLKIDSKCTYNGTTSNECGTWDPVDLSNQKFFNFADWKPGDYGENTISLDLFNNPAHACVIVENMHDNDLSLTEPESEAGDTTVGANNGELSPQLHFFTWADDGDNIWEANEPVYFSNIEGPASDVLNGKSYKLPDLQPGTSHIGVYWCYGALTVDQSGHTFTCNGLPVDNKSQTDQLTANIRFYVEQARNNNSFQCPAPVNTAMDTQSLENKDGSWIVIPNDRIDGTIIYSNGDHRFHGSVSAEGLVPNSLYQITLNGPGSCTTTDDKLAGFGANLFQSGYYNGGTDLSSTCASGEGVYNMNLINDHYTVKSDASGQFVYLFDLALPTGTYSNVKVLVKKMLDTHVSPWVDSATVHTSNLFETSALNFSVN